MILESLIPWAHAQGASDLHLEPGLPAAIRVRGSLRVNSEPVAAPALLAEARELIGPDAWPLFEERRSIDFSRSFSGIRCRVNVLHSSRGVGFAIRLLTSFSVTLDKLNLHPELRRFLTPAAGLVIVTGPTGCGKSTTLAALIQELNLSEARHIVTVESPIEFSFVPRRSYIRQREVGRDTPSFEQALLDALREDPDVLMIGEMRDPETMRLTLGAAETGHLVFVTMHSGTCTEALQRLAASFPPETQASVCAQLADCLVGVVAQRLRHRPDLNICVPECEILTATIPVRHMIRSREFFKLPQLMEIGAEHGMWSFARYQNWLASRTQWHIPSAQPEKTDAEDAAPAMLPVPAPLPRKSSSAAAAPAAPKRNREDGAVEIGPVEGGLDAVLKKLI